jgi:hypothetical protein
MLPTLQWCAGPLAKPSNSPGRPPEKISAGFHQCIGTVSPVSNWRRVAVQIPNLESRRPQAGSATIGEEYHDGSEFWLKPVALPTNPGVVQMRTSPPALPGTPSPPSASRIFLCHSPARDGLRVLRLSSRAYLGHSWRPLATSSRSGAAPAAPAGQNSILQRDWARFLGPADRASTLHPRRTYIRRPPAAKPKP